jgi:hypothetical protein
MRDFNIGHNTTMSRTEMAITAPAAPIFSKRIIKMMEGKSAGSASVEAAAAAVLVSTFMEPTGVGAAAAGAGAGASLPGCNQEGVSAMFF